MHSGFESTHKRRFDVVPRAWTFAPCAGTVPLTSPSDVLHLLDAFAADRRARALAAGSFRDMVNGPTVSA